MRLSTLIRRWGVFAATVFLLIGLTLANLDAAPVSGYGTSARYGFWLATAVATFFSWWLSQWLLVSGRDRLSRGLLLASCLFATLVFVPASMAIDVLFSLPESEPLGLSLLLAEWLASALPVFSSCMIASLPAWLSTSEALSPLRPAGHEPTAVSDEGDATTGLQAEPVTGAVTGTPVEPPAGSPTETPLGLPESSDGGLLPIAVRGGVLRATADLQYVHLQSSEGVTTVPGPMHRVIGLLGGQGLEVRRGEWIADRHVKQLKSVRGRWVVLLKDGQQVTVGRRRLAEVKERWGSTRFA